jgi:urease accessory protein
MTMLAHLRLLQMTSQAFPIGGYSHSYGLEAAIELKSVRDEESVREWIADVLAFSMGAYEMPVLHDMGEAWSARDIMALGRLNAQFLAARESAELRSATVQMGFSMRKLLAALPNLAEFLQTTLRSMEEPSLPCVWSGAACAWEIPASDSMAAYLWSWAENQVLVAMKSVPIGQSTGQRVLLKIGEHIAQFIERGPWRDEHLRSNFAPGLAILCSQHETQYSRLFRS